MEKARVKKVILYWTDEAGNSYRVPTSSARMDYPKFEAHARIRAFVHRRDNFTCQKCGAKLVKQWDIPYDGRYAVCANVPRRILLVLDHIVSNRNGGTHHPDNLQILCDPCNARKSVTHDTPRLAWSKNGLDAITLGESKLV